MNDYTTDLQLQFRKVADASPYPQEWVQKLQTEYPQIKPLIIKGKTIEQVFFACAGAAEDLPRFDVRHQEDSEGRIEGVYTSMFLRKKEDITILVAPGSDATEVVVNMRARGQQEGSAVDGNERISKFLSDVKGALDDET